MYSKNTVKNLLEFVFLNFICEIMIVIWYKIKFIYVFIFNMFLPILVYLISFLSTKIPKEKPYKQVSSEMSSSSCHFLNVTPYPLQINAFTWCPFCDCVFQAADCLWRHISDILFLTCGPSLKLLTQLGYTQPRKTPRWLSHKQLTRDLNDTCESLHHCHIVSGLERAVTDKGGARARMTQEVTDYRWRHWCEPLSNVYLHINYDYYLEKCTCVYIYALEELFNRYRFSGIENEKLCRWMMVMVAQQCECT